MKELVGTLRYLLDFDIHFILSIYCSQQTIIMVVPKVGTTKGYYVPVMRSFARDSLCVLVEITQMNNVRWDHSNVYFLWIESVSLT